MSASSDASDPVVTVLELLQNTADSDWPADKPEPIELQWESTQRVKHNRTGIAAYVWSPETGSREQFSAQYDHVDVREVVGVDVWDDGEDTGYGSDYGASYGTAENKLASVASATIEILEDYINDNYGQTEWKTIRPMGTDDRRAEALARRTDHQVITVAPVELHKLDSTGT